MKKYLLPLIAATAILFASCNKSKTNDDTSAAFGQDVNFVTLMFSPYNMEPIRDDIGSVVNRLDVWLIEGDNVYDYHQLKTETASFGTFHLTLNRTKTYTLIAVGHKADGQAALSDGIISFPNDKVTHSLYYSTTFTPATTTTLNCQMQRIVGMFKFTITDDLPGEVDHMKFTISESGTRFNTATMEAVNKIERVAIPSSMNPNAAGDYVFNIYVMADDMESITNVDITVQALDETEGIIEQRDFSEVPIKDGWVTSYTGTFFVTEPMTINFTVGGWENFEDHPY